MNEFEKFDKLCTQIFYLKGEFCYPFDEIKNDNRFGDIIKNQDYPILETKIKNLLVLINKDLTKIDLDTQVLWEMI